MRNAGILAAGVLAALTAATAASAALGPVGDPFNVSSCTSCQELTPAIAGSPSGAFAAVWEGSTASDSHAVSRRFFSSAGTPVRPTDLPIPETPTPDQYDAVATVDTAGNFVVVWSAVAGGNSDIFARKFQANGAPLGPSFKVNADAAGTPTIPADMNPAVARTNDGGFVVAWISLLPASATFSGTNPIVLARKLSSAGAPVGNQVQLSTGLVHGSRPDVCVDTSGEPIVVWTSVDAFRPFQSNLKGVSLRRMTPAGAAIEAAETVVASPLAGSTRAAVACGGGSTFLVVWSTDLAPGGNRTDILGQRYSRLGRKTGVAFRINGEIAGDQTAPAAIYDTNNTFVVVWQSEVGTREKIVGRRFNSNASAQAADFEIKAENQGSTVPQNPDIAPAGPAGSFVVVWQEGSKSIMARRYKQSGRKDLLAGPELLP
jgi:hypothetical protein